MDSTDQKLITPIRCLAFAIGMGSYFHFSLGVRISATELTLPILFILLATSISRGFQTPKVTLATIFLVLHICAVVFSDGMNDVELIDSIKAAARPFLMFCFFLIGTGLCESKEKWFVPYVIGLAAGSTCHFLFNTGNDPYNFEEDKSGYSFFVFRIQPMLDLLSILAITICLAKLNNRFIAFAIAAVACGVSLRYGARSSFLVWVPLVAFLFLELFLNRVSLAKIVGGPIRVAVLATAVSWLAYTSYAELASQGYLGEMRQAKFTGQSKSSESGLPAPIALLVGGRPEALVSIFKIIDNPFFGHGSSSYDYEYVTRAYDVSGTKDRSKLRNYAVVNSNGGHSVMFHAWAANGILTLPYYLLCLVSFYKCAMSKVRNRSATAAVTVLLGCLVSWDIFFSPLSVQMRCLMPMLLAYCIYEILALEKVGGAVAVEFHGLRRVEPTNVISDELVVSNQ